MAEITKMTSAGEADLDKMTGWMYTWWGKEQGFSREAVRCYIEHGMSACGLPQTYGLLDGGELIGMYQFLYCDLEVRPDIYPWLANVYVEKERRGRGFGRKLLESVRDSAARNTDFEYLYLFTAHNGLYEKYGWEFVSEIDTFGKKDRIQRLYRLGLKR